MPALEPLRGDHAAALLDFELANRAYFAGFISDRGEAFFEHFGDRLEALLAEQEAGTGAFYVLVEDDGSVVGRLNLQFLGDGVAVLGYRVAQGVSGRGVATSAVGELSRLAASRHGIRTIRAATSDQNVASQRVLAKVGFLPAGPAEPAAVGGKHGSWYRLDLGDADASS